MKRNWKTRCLAGALAGAMTVMGLPVITVNAEENVPVKLADFNFNEEAADSAFAGGNARAATNGTCKIDAKTGEDSALYLDGSSYLNVTMNDGGALLAGKEEITVSYDAKAEKNEKSWTFFAARDANKSTYKNEHYFATIHNSGSITVQRFNNTNERPENDVTFASGGGWMHVDVVYAASSTKLYVNGELKGETSKNIYKLSDILGTTGGIVQIGKANWDNGEFFKGWLDNYRIYDGVLSEASIQTQYQEFQESMEAITEWENRPATQKDYDDLEILNKDDVRGNLALIKKGRYGSTIEWTSTNTDVVTDTAAESSLYDGGIVTRPEAGSDPVTLTLTAKLSYPEQEDKTKTFEVTVQPKEANLDTDYTAGYLWTNFGTEDGYEKIFLGYSEDGLTWKKLNKTDGVSKAILTNNAKGSDLGVRDPHIIRSPEGDRYWIIGTDLHAEGGGAGGSGWNQLNSSQNIVVWESNDLVNWSEPRLVYAGFEQAGCVWAPEAIYDEVSGDYIVYWSIRDKSKADTDENALRVYVCRTRDFKTFSESKIWLSEDQDSGKEVNIIDSTIVKGDDNKFYRFSTSDWNTVIDVSDTLDTEDVLDVRADAAQSKPNGSWKRLVTRSGSSTAGFDSREGFTVYKLPDGKWCAMGDHDGYKAFVTDDLASGKWTAATADFVDGRFRHGTVVRLSKTEEARILESYGEKFSEGNGEEPVTEPVLEYNFEQDLGSTTMTDTAVGNETKDNGTLFGNAKVIYDEDRQSNVLQLDGSDGAYAEIPKGFFDKRNYMTISMDVKTEAYDGNVFTFTYGKDNTHYNFLRIKDTTVRNAITVNSYGEEKEMTAVGAANGKWQRVVIVADGASMRLYLDGRLVAKNENTGLVTASLGTDLLSYLGKSFYSADKYFKGSFDNIKVYNRAFNDDEVVEEIKDRLDEIPLLSKIIVGTIPENPSATMGTDDHTAATTKIDSEKHEITSYVMRGTELTSIPVSMELLTKSVTVTADGKPFTGGTLDLSQDVDLEVSYLGKTETYTLKTPKFANNPVLPGQYADPDIDYFDGKYWLYPTTDGYSGWSGTQFHAWSSKNLIDWTDEGVILDVADKNPGVNEKGVQIAFSKWSSGNAWAPTIEKKGDKYYFYYCGHDTATNAKAIGVAWADNPAGPFTAKDTPIISIDDCKKVEKIDMGQAIDPSIFKDTDGKYYMTFGNGNPAIVELNDDMISFKSGTMKNLKGLDDFRESVVITKRDNDNKYHFTWSCDDANSPNYHVNYGTSESISGPVEYKYTLLQKDEEGDMLGTAHQSVVYNPDTEKYYLSYHRFYTPLGIYTSGLGVHRTTCIDEITFDENGLMKPMKPTMEGVLGEEQSKLEEVVSKVDMEADVFQGGTISAAETIALPKNLENGTVISWKSGNTAVIAENGAVTLPKVDTIVKMTATFTSGNVTVTQTYPVTVKGTGFTLKYAAGAGGKITGNAAQTVLSGKDASTVTAVADAGYHFVKWSDGVTTAARTDKNVTADINVTAQFEKDKEVVTPSPVTVTKVKLNTGKITLGVGEKYQLTATVETNSSSADAKKVTWSSNSKNVTVDKNNGKVTAKKKGSATITATTGDGAKETCKITVKPAPTKKTKITVGKITVKVKKSKTIKPKVKGNFGCNTFKYKVKNKKIAKVDKNGKVTGVKKGKTTVTITTYNYNKKKKTGATKTVNVTVK